MEIVYTLQELHEALRSDVEDNYDISLPLDFNIICWQRPAGEGAEA